MNYVILILCLKTALKSEAYKFPLSLAFSFEITRHESLQVTAL